MGDGGIQREVLPIPDRWQIGLTTYNAKDPDTSFPRSGGCGRPGRQGLPLPDRLDLASLA